MSKHLKADNRAGAHMVSQPGRLISRFYVPFGTLVLLLIFGNYLATLSQIDPLSLAQNRRMRFQTGDSLAANPSLEFTPAERKWADAVVRDGFKRESNRPAILYFGDSQTMALVDWRAGDLTAPQWLQIFLLRRLGTRTRQSSSWLHKRT